MGIVTEVEVSEPFRDDNVRCLKKDVKKDLKATMEDGVIEKYHSQLESPLVIVRKSSGDVRICVDYRKLNQATQVTSYPSPNITEALDHLSERGVILYHH